MKVSIGAGWAENFYSGHSILASNGSTSEQLLL
jgi:hypothetical protein